MKSFILHSSLWLKHSAESSITPESKVEEPRLVRFPLRTGHNQATVQDSVYFNAVCLFCFHSFVSCGAMSSLVDSTAQFETQLRDTRVGSAAGDIIEGTWSQDIGPVGRHYRPARPANC